MFIDAVQFALEPAWKERFLLVFGQAHRIDTRSFMENLFYLDIISKIILHIHKRLEEVNEWTVGLNLSARSHRPRRDNHGVHCTSEAHTLSSCQCQLHPPIQVLHKQPKRHLQEESDIEVAPRTDPTSRM
jgi:hypothetical protein